MRLIIFCAATLLAGCGEEMAFTVGAPAPIGVSPRPPAGGNAIPPPTQPTTQLVTLRNLVRTQDAGGDIRILGEVITTSSRPLVFVKVACTFKDASDIVIGDESTYIVSRVVKLTSINSNTNTALRTDDVGYFDILTSRKDVTVSSYSCEATYRFSPSSTPSALLEVQGTPTVTSDSIANTMYVGNVKNAGTAPLIFGKVYAATFSKTGALIDVSSAYISGQTGVTLTGTTDTALDAERIGTFTINTLSAYSVRGTTTYLYDWQDVATLGTPAAGLTRADQSLRMSHEELHALRNKEIEDIKNMYTIQ